MKNKPCILIAFILGSTLSASSQLVRSLVFIGQDRYGHTRVYTEDGSPLYSYRLEGYWTDFQTDVVRLMPREGGWDTLSPDEYPVYPYGFYYGPGTNAEPYQVVSRFRELQSRPVFPMVLPVAVDPVKGKRPKPQPDTSYYLFTNSDYLITRTWVRYYQKEIRDTDGKLLELVSGYGDHEQDTTVSELDRSRRCRYRIYYNKKGHITLIEGEGDPFPNEVFNRVSFPWAGPKHYHRYVYDKQGRLVYIISSFGHKEFKETQTLSLDYLSLIRQIGQNCDPDVSPWGSWPGIDYTALDDLDSARLAGILKGKIKTVEGTLLAEPDNLLSPEDRKRKALLKENLPSDVYWILHEPQVVEFTYGKYGPVTARLYDQERNITVYDSLVYDSLGRPYELHSGSCPYGDDRKCIRYIYDKQGRLAERIDETYTLHERDTPELRHWEMDWSKEIYSYDAKGRLEEVSQTWEGAEQVYVQCRFFYQAP